MTAPSRSPRPVLGLICCTRLVGSEPAQAVMNRYVQAAAQYADASTLLIPTPVSYTHLTLPTIYSV